MFLLCAQSLLQSLSEFDLLSLKEVFLERYWVTR